MNKDLIKLIFRLVKEEKINEEEFELLISELSKGENVTTYPIYPIYPTYPTYPTQPTDPLKPWEQPWITWSTTGSHIGSGCDHLRYKESSINNVENNG